MIKTLTARIMNGTTMARVSNTSVMAGGDGRWRLDSGNSAIRAATVVRGSIPCPIRKKAEGSSPNGIRRKASTPAGMMMKPISGMPARLASTDHAVVTPK